MVTIAPAARALVHRRHRHERLGGLLPRASTKPSSLATRSISPACGPNRRLLREDLPDHWERIGAQAAPPAEPEANGADIVLTLPSAPARRGRPS
ncbi:hypothetical protein [Parafrankia discariae]|uniref:hypothetical protein n=1 Tax=Parafrankia discariae TaxID=365528 RepID=UPI00039ABF9E|nr:hypothetical protein [Parafrankia discariae]